MTATLRASATAKQASVAGKLSAERGGVLNVRIGGILSGNLQNVYVAAGPSAGPPASYAAITLDLGGPVPPSESSATLAYNVADDTYEITLSIPVAEGVLTAAQTVYVALFTSGSPGPTDAPVVVAGPFLVTA